MRKSSKKQKEIKILSDKLEISAVELLEKEVKMRKRQEIAVLAEKIYLMKDCAVSPKFCFIQAEAFFDSRDTWRKQND